MNDYQRFDTLRMIEDTQAIVQALFAVNDAITKACARRSDDDTLNWDGFQHQSKLRDMIAYWALEAHELGKEL